VVITIHPLPLPFVPVKITFATTPLPNKIMSVVPINSAKNGVIYEDINFL
jgi:hypothetical protein